MRGIGFNKGSAGNKCHFSYGLCALPKQLVGQFIKWERFFFEITNKCGF